VTLAGIVLASLLFRVHVSRECSLWLDETITRAEVLEPWPAVLAGPERAHPPLLFVLTKAVTQVFGAGETSLRAVSLVFGCVLLVAVYWLGAELGLKPLRRLAVVASLAVTPFFLRHATEARQYSLFPAFGALAIAAVLRLWREPVRLGYLALFATSAAGMALTHYFGLPYAVALFGVVLLGTFVGWSELVVGRRTLALALMIVLLLLGVFVWVALRAVALAHYYERSRSASGTVPWPDLLRELLREFAFTTAPSIRIPQAVLAAVGLALLGRSLRGVARAVPATLAFGPCLVALFITSGHFVAARYLAPSWMLYHLGACAALFELGDRARLLAARAPARWGAALAWAPFVLPLGLRFAEYPDAYGTGEDDYRGFQREFLARFARDTALVTYDSRFADRILSAYGVGQRPLPLEKFRRLPGVKRYLVAEIHVRGAARRAKLEELVAARMGVSPSVWQSLPLVDLPETTYQPSVPARLVVFDDDESAALPAIRTEGERPRKHRRHAPLEHEFSE